MRLSGSLFCLANRYQHATKYSSVLSFYLRGRYATEWFSFGLIALIMTVQFPDLAWLFVLLGTLAIRFSEFLMQLTDHPLFLSVGGWKAIGVLAGVLLFAGISTGADPALAIFDKAEQQASSIFGEYIDNKIITFLFGLLRIVVWITAVGFILFAVYQAQRGEQWQPLMQNAFIVLAAVVVVEGLSTLFFK